MNETKETNSGAHGGAGSQTQKNDDDVVFTTILRKDRDWLNDPLHLGANRQDKLHRILQKYQKMDLALTYEADGALEIAAKLRREAMRM